MDKSLSTAMNMSLNREIPDKSLLLDMLNYEIDSPEYVELGEVARSIAKTVDNTGKIWASIGIDSKACPMNCNFCSFGEKWHIFDQTTPLSEEDIFSHAKYFIQNDVRWITLRTTEDYDSLQLLSIARDMKNNFPGNYGLVANTGDATAGKIDTLLENGYEIVYHALRLREGIDTPFLPENRLKTLHKIGNSPLDLAFLTEPVGPEHSSEEIAVSILTAIQVGAQLSGAMSRIPVEGTPLYTHGQISEKRLAQIIAVTRITGGYHTPNICAHPPSKQVVDFGANVLVAETGTIPRDHLIQSSEWKGYTIENEKNWFLDAEYELWENTNEESP